MVQYVGDNTQCNSIMLGAPLSYFDHALSTSPTTHYIISLNSVYPARLLELHRTSAASPKLIQKNTSRMCSPCTSRMYFTKYCFKYIGLFSKSKLCFPINGSTMQCHLCHLNQHKYYSGISGAGRNRQRWNCGSLIAEEASDRPLPPFLLSCWCSFPWRGRRANDKRINSS